MKSRGVCDQVYILLCAPQLRHTCPMTHTEMSHDTYELNLKNVDFARINILALFASLLCVYVPVCTRMRGVYVPVCTRMRASVHTHAEAGASADCQWSKRIVSAL